MHISTKINPNGSKESFIHICFWESVLISKFQSIDECKQYEDINIYFPDCLSNYQDNWEFIIPLKNLHAVGFYEDLQSILNLIKSSFEFLFYLNKAKSVLYNLEFWSDINLLQEAITLLPSHTKFIFTKDKQDEIDEIDNIYQNIIKDKNLHLLLNKIKISALYIPQIDDDNFLWCWDILNSLNTRISLTWVEIKLSSLSEAIDIINLLSFCPNLENVVITYETVDIEDSEESIKFALSSFQSKVGFITYLCFTQD